MSVPRAVRRMLLPASVFLAVALIHYLWLGFFPEHDHAQDRWASVPVHVSWAARYIETQSYWLGFSYGLSLAFAAVAFRRYREGRFCTARNLAIGGVTFSGVLSVVGCYLLGCCGSPMLAVYLNLFGAAFIPLAKPLMAGITAISILLAWLWMNRRIAAQATSCCSHASCSSNENGGSPSVEQCCRGTPDIPSLQHRGRQMP